MACRGTFLEASSFQEGLCQVHSAYTLPRLRFDIPLAVCEDMTRNVEHSPVKFMNKTEPKELICDICGRAGAKVRHVSRSYGKGETLLVIENIPLISCPHCGESYFTAETLHELERIKIHQSSLAVPRQVPVAEFT
jgi:YgiT-type zinc finger domain-containing protein